MSNAKSQAVDDIRKLGRTLKGLMDLAGELEHGASLEQAMMDTKSRVEKLMSEEEVLKAKKLAAEDEIALAEAKAKEIIDYAKSIESGILKEAQDEAALIVKEAHTKAYEKQTSSDVEQAKALAELTGIKSDVASLSREKNELEATLMSLKAELEALKKRIG